MGDRIPVVVDPAGAVAPFAGPLPSWHLLLSTSGAVLYVGVVMAAGLIGHRGRKAHGSPVPAP